jgi:hypothetical protein
MEYATFTAAPTQPVTEYRPADGISGQGVLTLVLLAAIGVVVARSSRKVRRGGDAPRTPVQPTPPGAPPVPLAKLPEVSMADLRGTAPEETPAEKGPSLLSASAAKLSAHKLGIPYELAERLQKSKWSEMCRSRKLPGLERGDMEKTPYGVAVHVKFRGSLDFASVQRGLGQLETGLDTAAGSLRLRQGATAGSGVIDIRLRDPLKGGVPWEQPVVPVRLAHPLRLAVTPFGDTVELDLKQRVGVFGTSGSGKSCVQRLIGAHVAAAIDADLEIWDLKFGVESQHYAGKAHRVTSVEEAVDRVEWLLNTEYPRRAAKMRDRGVSEWTETPWDPARVVVIDEGNMVVRGFGEWRGDAEEGERPGAKGAPLLQLFQAIEQGRALGVYFVWATQFPKSTNLPTEIRSQLNSTVCLKLRNDREARVVFGDEGVSEGWAPHNLLGPGWLLLQDEGHPDPVDAKSVWLSVDTFRSVPASVQDSDTDTGQDTDREPLQSRTPGQSLPGTEFVQGQDSVKLSAVPDRTASTVSMDIWTVLALSEDSLSLSEIARRSERSKSAVHAALGKMTEDGTVVQDDVGYRLAVADTDCG